MDKWFTGIRDFIDSFLPSVTYDSKDLPLQKFVKSASSPSNDPNDIKMTMGISPDFKVINSDQDSQDSPMPQSTQAPQEAQITPNGGFRYVMGKNNYSDVADQVQSALQGTPLEPYANDFIKAGEKYGVDPRVLPTIANNESSMGKNYPTNTYNPFGYNASGAGMITGADGKQYVNVDQGLQDAGFTSLPMAIDRLTNRFSRQPTDNYKKFYNEPTTQNLSAAYNATPTENEGYIKNANDFVSKFK